MKINEYMEATFDSAIPPAPRPTCGTCPHWIPDAFESKTGNCTLYPPTIIILRPVHDERGYETTQEPEAIHHSQWCGQHPDMAAWIEKEWPKVRDGR